MPQRSDLTLRRRITNGALNLFARLAYQTSRRGVPRGGKNESVARILVLELWNIGDVILAMPFLAQLRCVFPRAAVTLVSRPFAEDLLAGTGLVDEFIPADLTWVAGAHLRLPKKSIDLWRVSRKLGSRVFDVAFSSRPHVSEHLLLTLSGAKRRVGYAVGEPDSVLTDAVVSDAHRHKVDDWLRLLEPFGGATSAPIPRLHVEESERAWANGYLTSRGLSKDDLLVGMHPGASLAEKRWPLERFREVATATARQPGVRMLIFAEPSGYGFELFAIPGVIGAQVALRELIALIQRCGLLICNDSGPMHIAAALGVPTIAMFGSGIDQWFAPLGEGHEILRPDPNNSMDQQPAVERGIRTPREIRSAQVLDAVGRAVQRLRNRGQSSRF